VLTTEAVTGDLKTGEANTNGPVIIKTDGTKSGGSAKISAGNLQLQQHGAIIKLSGGVKGTFTPADDNNKTESDVKNSSSSADAATGSTAAESGTSSN